MPPPSNALALHTLRSQVLTRHLRHDNQRRQQPQTMNAQLYCDFLQFVIIVVVVIVATIHNKSISEIS